jgi:predicted CoA-substrate-specific enzyme activase
MITCGVDIGSRSIEVVLFDGAQVIEAMIVETGSQPRENARRSLNEVLSSSGLKRRDLAQVVATGYGRNHFDGADKVSSEILCHAMGISYLFPNARTVIDIGGQDSKIIGLGLEGKVENFTMNDRCAAGTGKFIEMVGHTLQVPPDEMGAATADSSDSCEISSMCAVFAESEIISMIQNGTRVDVVLRGVFKAIARRILSMIGKVRITEKVVFTGGVAKNQGVVRALEQEAGIKMHVPYEPQITGALGASIIASSATSGQPLMP